MATFQLYADAGLTTPWLPADRIGPVTAPPEDFVIYFGSTNALNKVEAVSAPGTDPILVNIVDSAPGSNLEASDIKLATTNAGLTAATPGAALNLGPVINGGVGNAVEIHLRIDFAAGGAVTDETVIIETNDLVESNI